MKREYFENYVKDRFKNESKHMKNLQKVVKLFLKKYINN